MIISGLYNFLFALAFTFVQVFFLSEIDPEYLEKNLCPAFATFGEHQYV